ncbi:dnaJ homolog subfamily C member 13 isoform X2 [Planococcus citri]|uniref:dnaJ homolog subfamily C member 13 isoform X2 n=1 Tax=Planococcus citri TaxID=170843 RepID=UPI0031F77F94
MGSVISNDKMIPLPNNSDLGCYHVTKHSWKGKYSRIFSIGSHGITTYNCSTLEITNRWLYEDIVSVIAQPQQHEFIITIKKGKDKKPDTMRFSSVHRSHILSDALKHRHLFAGKKIELNRYEAFKHHWSDTKLPVMLEVTPFSLDQLDITTAQVLASYCYKDIKAIQDVSDIPDGFVIIIAPDDRLHLFSCRNKREIFTRVKELAIAYLALPVVFSQQSITYDEFVAQRFGQFSADEHITTVSEFTVNKVKTLRHTDIQRRLLCISETCIIERDPQTYTIVTLRPLSSVFALIRDATDSQLFSIEYCNGYIRSYAAPQRDSLLATLLDGVRSTGNHNVHVKMNPTPRGKRLIPFNALPEEELELTHLKFLSQPPARKQYSEIIERFNANVPYSGLLHSVTQDGIFSENKEKLIIMALQALMLREGDQNEISFPELEAQFQALRRLVASKVGFAALTMLTDFREKLGRKVTRALKRENEAITHAAIDMICALMQPMHQDYDLHREQLNKSSLLSTQAFLKALLDMWVAHIKRNTGALVVAAMLDMLTFALCIPYSETTEGKHFDALLEMVAERGRSLFQLFQHSSLTIVKGAGLVMRAIIEEGEPGVAKRMQELALSEGALLTHLLYSLFTRDDDKRLLAHRQLSRHLVGLWVTNNDTAMDLLTRILPCGLLNFLESDEAVPEDYNGDHLITRDNLKLAQDHAARNQRNPHLVAIERKWRTFEKEVEYVLSHWGTSLGLERREKEEKIKDRPIVLRKRRERVKSASNWRLFYYKFNLNHILPSLIWNHKTREELKESLEKELRTFAVDREVSTNTLISWNHAEFEIQYNCLQDEVCIDGYYLRLLLENNCDSLIKNPFNFFNDLYHRFLLANKVELKCLCLQAMTVVYSQYYEQIGPFSDTKYIVSMLEKCTDRMERDRLILFLNKLILNKENAKAVIDAKGVQTLVDLLTLAHMHTSRAVMPAQSNVIEAGNDMMRDNEKEWYYGSGEERKGPVTFTELQELYKTNALHPRSKCWAQGMDGWRLLQQVSQLKWTLFAKGTAILNESELASMLLSILIRMCQFFPSRDGDGAVIWPIPKIKRILSDPQCMPHVVQLLLTFDPILVEKVASLLCEVSADNPTAAKFYLTGVFFFILMYTGSNVLPVARFLRMTHIKQAFRSENVQSCELMQRSILGPLLPDAMVYYLENHGPEKFAQIFLGEFDTPEAIWNAEMRRLLIEKIAYHISDFTPRLRGNNKALYQYCGIPTIRYPQLQAELFCNIYYLRHLCDVTRFPDWPITEPVKLLRDVLEAWREEVEKKPPTMSVDDAYEALGLARGQCHEEHIIRKAYYKLAQIYHPDKNPKGKDKFMVANNAYDFLCSRCSWVVDGPNPNNIVLILKTQSILFHRYSAELQPYKYAGYKQLIKTIRLETSDEQLFSKSAMLLTAATELAYHTVKCSALNAEELNREYGFISLMEAYSRCVSVLSRSSKVTDMAVMVCSHCTRCFSVAAQFSACRETFVSMPQLIPDLVRILRFRNLTKLCCDVVECIISFSREGILQQRLIEEGCIWYLLSFLFKYDYTLEECGVERSEDANTQEVLNKLAKLSVNACAALGGYLDKEITTPVNEIAQKIFNQLLTPYMSNLLGNDDPHQLLKILTSNCETPYLIWNNSTRAELNDFLDHKRKEQRNLKAENLQNIEINFSSHTNELIIGNVFIRIYNSQPGFVIENPKGFLHDLMEFIKNNCPKQGDDIDKIKRTTMALHALNNLISNTPGLEILCIGYFQLLFSLLNCKEFQAIQEGALHVIATATRNQECVNDIAAIGVVVYLLLALYSLPSEQPLVLTTLSALSTSSTIVKDVLSKGGYIYLLDLLCNSSNWDVRTRTTELFSRLLSDKLSGPRVKLSLNNFLPHSICETLKDSPAAVLSLLDSSQENPELVWNDKIKKKICNMIRKYAKRLYEMQQSDPQTSFKPPDEGVLPETNEVVIGGVYLRLFNQNPGWNVRRPKEFLNELLDACINMMAKDQHDKLELFTTSVIRLLESQPNLSDHVPSLGYIPKLCLQLSSHSNCNIPLSAITILHQLSLSEVCVNSISQTECLGPMKEAMRQYSDIVGIASETLSRIFVGKKDNLVKQALDCELIPFLLQLLDGRLDGVENSARVRAHIVKTLKNMSYSITYGNSVISILDKSPIWSTYREQKHDLFITNSNALPYLTGGLPTNGGYLTQGNASVIPSGPPPLNDDE